MSPAARCAVCGVPIARRTTRPTTVRPWLHVVADDAPEDQLPDHEARPRR